MRVLELEGLKFTAVQDGVSIDGPVGGYWLTYGAITALVDWLAVEFDKRKAEPTSTAMGAWRRGLSPEALTAAVWNGEGWPPVGCECEACWGSGDYLPVKILADDEGAIVFRWKAGKRKGKYGHYSELRFNEYPAFRPLRTAEQLAAEAREAEIQGLADKIAAAGWKTPEILAVWLHDHGYRKSDA